jgi:Leucine-rich repeat (LRR) protein
MQFENQGNDDKEGNANEGTNDTTNHELPLEWAQLGSTAQEAARPIRYITDVAEISPQDLEICIVGTAGQKITHMGKDFSKHVSPQLTQLILRSHLIKVMEGLQGLEQLELLELYDNQVEALACLESCGPNLRVLDMSYNVIRDMQPVHLCQNLQELCTYR